ncbi:NAD(P)/FAD-dependent oxidoreductase [Bordetella muralis]|uniref:NAD(P)/FAD-dependent oxidoreductase n=1 Tax=Bordetella muralis TaxID=1649130 RepID=UPI0039F10CE8
MVKDYDYIVAGAGMVGAAIAAGLAAQGKRVLMLDGADTDLRAAKANFGLVWVQGKGYGNPHYQRLSRLAAQLWPAFAEELERETGITLDYEQRGGLHFCLGQAQWDERALRMRQWQAQAAETEPCIDMLDRGGLERLFPAIRWGAEVSGASFGQMDGHVNPLCLLAALQAAFISRGGELHSQQPVQDIQPQQGGGFLVHAGKEDRRAVYGASNVVLAAGLGSVALGPMVALDVPLRPQRGQLLVTERVAPLLPVPASGLRQTGEGTVMIGVTQEEVGYDLSTTTDAAVRMSRKALHVLPDLAGARWVRHWSCLRVMTPDGVPVYAESTQYPGAWTALCHSGVTLASFHAGPFARALAEGALPDSLEIFHHERFDVSQAA